MLLVYEISGLESAENLKVSLDRYWPVINPEDNGIQESNLTVHLAHASMQYGLLCYPEASHGYNKNGNKRIDLLVNGDIEGQEVTFLVEAKKMYSSEQASKMFCDFQKMKIFAPVSDSIKKPEYAVLLAVTVSSSNAEWWSNPYECSSNGWNQLMGALNQCEVHGTIMLDTQYRQHIVYAIAKL